ncbi:hypothetical protein HBI08_235970, partial [Parastagonospora nodorum]
PLIALYKAVDNTFIGLLGGVPTDENSAWFIQVTHSSQRQFRHIWSVPKLKASRSASHSNGSRRWSGSNMFAKVPS